MNSPLETSVHAHTALGHLSKVPLRQAWRHEALDFTPWLAEEANLNLLAEELGLSELVLTATEHPVGDFNVDILCSNGDETVIIENQMEATNHDHLGKIITYAAGVNARQIIWVAASFRPEHLAALEFLNENMAADLGFFAVRIELWRIGNSPLAPKFNVVARPDNWTRAEREQAKATTEASPTKQLQLRFWKSLVAYLAEHAPGIRPQTPRPQHWLNNTIGRSGFRLNMTVNTRDDRLTTEVYIGADNAKDQFDRLAEEREEIEQELGFTLDWQRLPEATACRIAAVLEGAKLDDDGRWPEYHQWFASRLTRMDKAFRARIKALP